MVNTGTPARSKVLTADRRMSCTKAPGQPATLQASFHGAEVADALAVALEG